MLSINYLQDQEKECFSNVMLFFALNTNTNHDIILQTINNIINPYIQRT